MPPSTVRCVDELSRLAVAARSGDDHALTELVEVAYEQVWRLCAALVDTQSADDLAQDALIRAIRALPEYRGDSSARTWLLAITRYTCLDELRGRDRRRRRNASLPTPHPADPAVSDPSDHLVVADLLRHLDPDRRAAFVLTQMLGLPYRQAAEICDCPTGTIRSRVARARTDLLALLAEDESDTIPSRTQPGTWSSA